MTMELMANHVRDGGFRPKIPPAASCMSMALAQVLARRFGPIGIRKNILRAWPDLTEDEARACVEGTASKRTLTRVMHHSRGGWSVALEVMALIIGEGLDDHLAQQKEHHDELARRSAALHRDLRAVALGDPGVRPGLPSWADRDAGADAGRAGGERGGAAEGHYRGALGPRRQALLSDRTAGEDRP